MWTFDNPSVTFDNPGYTLDGSGGAALPQPSITSLTPSRDDGPPVVHSVSVAFSTHTEYDHYQIQRADGLTPDEGDFALVADEVTASPYVDDELDAETDYSYRVRGVVLP
jgi:hypothetical protein